jgi:competence protein ComEA
MFPKHLLQPTSQPTADPSQGVSIPTKIVHWLVRYRQWFSYGLIGVGLVSLAYGMTLTLGVAQTRAVEPGGSHLTAEWYAKDPALLTDDRGGLNGGDLAVDVGGAVLEPGIYYLPAGSRWAEAVAAAGGLHLEADLVYINRYLNLSVKLEDSQKIYIPFQNEEAWLAELLALGLPTGLTGAKDGFEQNSGSGGGSASGDAKPSNSGLVSINWASNSELQSLPGIGEKRAADIIAGRPYQSTEEVVARGILTQGVWEKIAQLVAL